MFPLIQKWNWFPCVYANKHLSFNICYPQTMALMSAIHADVNQDQFYWSWWQNNAKCMGKVIIIDLITNTNFWRKNTKYVKASSNENRSYSTLCCHLGIAVPGTKPHFMLGSATHSQSTCAIPSPALLAGSKLSSWQLPRGLES